MDIAAFDFGSTTDTWLCGGARQVQHRLADCAIPPYRCPVEGLAEYTGGGNCIAGSEPGGDSGRFSGSSSSYAGVGVDGLESPSSSYDGGGMDGKRGQSLMLTALTLAPGRGLVLAGVARLNLV